MAAGTAPCWAGGTRRLQTRRASSLTEHAKLVSLISCAMQRETCPSSWFLERDTDVECKYFLLLVTEPTPPPNPPPPPHSPPSPPPLRTL